MEIKTFADGLEILNQERKILVKIEDGEIGFPDEDYWIDLARIRSKADLVEWIHHLTGKRWFTSEHVEQFIEKVCSHKKWEIYRSA